MMEAVDDIPEETGSVLAELLGSFKEAGTVESEGAFSLDPMKALQKLGDFALPRLSAWVLLGVQAAVAGQCERCEISLSKTRVEFALSPAPAVDLHELMQSTLSGDLSMAPEYSFLSSLIRVVVARGWDLQLHKLNREEATGLRLEERALTWEEGEPVPSTDLLAVVVKRPSEPSARRERRELEEYAHPAPLELTLNQKRIDTFDKDHLSRLVGHGRELNLSLAASPGENGFQVAEDAPDALQDERYLAVALFEGRSPRPKVELNWIRYGVIMKTEEISSGYDVEAHCYTQAADLETDLSGFDLQTNQAFQQRRQLGLKLLYDACSEALLATETLHRPLSEKRARVRNAFKAVTILLLAPLTLYYGLDLGIVFSPGNRMAFLIMGGLRTLAVAVFGAYPLYLFQSFLVRLFVAPSTGLEHTLEDLEVLEKKLHRLS